MGAILATAALAAGCGDDGASSSRERIERVERRYEELWNAESVSCREAPGREGYECVVVSKQRGPDGPERAP